MKKFVRAESGFSLIETMVALSVMGIMLTAFVGFALLPYMRAQALTTSTNEILTDFRDVQVRAQAEVRRYRLSFNVLDNNYTVQRYEPGSACPDQWCTLNTRAMATGVNISEAAFTDPTSGSSTPTAIATFYPRGTSSTGKVILVHTDLNQDRQIQLQGLTSKSKVV